MLADDIWWVQRTFAPQSPNALCPRLRGGLAGGEVSRGPRLLLSCAIAVAIPALESLFVLHLENLSTAAQTAPNHAVLAAQKRTRTARRNRTANAPELRSESLAMGNTQPAELHTDSELAACELRFRAPFLMIIMMHITVCTHASSDCKCMRHRPRRPISECIRQLVCR